MESKQKLAIKIAQLKHELKFSWGQLGVFVGRSKHIDFQRLDGWSEKLMTTSIAKLEAAVKVNKEANKGSKCAKVKFKDVAENTKQALESRNIKAYVDEVDDEYIVSWE